MLICLLWSGPNELNFASDCDLRVISRSNKDASLCEKNRTEILYHPTFVTKSLSDILVFIVTKKKKLYSSRTASFLLLNSSSWKVNVFSYTRREKISSWWREYKQHALPSELPYFKKKRKQKQKHCYPLSSHLTLIYSKIHAHIKLKIKYQNNKFIGAPYP